MHSLFDPSTIDYDSFFIKFQQTGGAPVYFVGTRFQRGFGGVRVQTGYGIANVLASLLRFLIPVASKAGKSIAKEGLRVGSRILDDLAAGKEIKTTLKTHGQTGIENLVQKVGKSVKQTGGRRVIRSKNIYKGRSVPFRTLNKRKRDIFA